MFFSHLSSHRADRNGTPSKRRPGLWVQQAVLNIGLICLAAGAIFGKQMLLHFSLFIAVAACQSPPVQNLQLTDLYMIGTGAGTETLRVEWDGDKEATFFVQRTPGSASIIANTNGHGVLIDSLAPQPPPPPYPYSACNVTTSPLVSINVTPVQVMVLGNQTVDARYDPRYSTWTHLQS